MTAVRLTSEFGGARAEPDGTFVVTAGTTPSGQGHETAYGQLASGLLGVPMEAIRVVHSDTGAVTSGAGTSGSRSLQIGGSAVRKACIELIERAKAETARRLESAVEDIEQLDGGRF